jgi:GntR family transcriptional regulator
MRATKRHVTTCPSILALLYLLTRTVEYLIRPIVVKWSPPKLLVSMWTVWSASLREVVATSGDASPDDGAVSTSTVSRIYGLLADEIAAGARRVGDRLPPERVLAKELGVSRTTVRRALGALVADGLIESHVGRGAFVAGGRMSEPPNVLMSFSELGRRHGLTPSARVIAQGVRDATIDEARDFEIAPGSTVFFVERLRLLDQHPIAVDETRIPLDIAPGLKDADFTSASIYECLTASGHAPFRANYAVEAINAPTETARVLETETGAALLIANTRAFDMAGRLVELGKTTYRGDRYRFEATLRRGRRPWSSGE